MDTKKIILIGGGGHCSVIISILKRMNYTIEGIIDREEYIGKSIAGISVIGTDKDLSKYSNEKYKGLITVGSTGHNNSKRFMLYERALEAKLSFMVLISDKAIISPNAVIDAGSVIMDGSIISNNVKIGKNCIINTGSIIEHDCVLGDHVHCACRVTLCGGVQIGDSSFIGASSTIIQNIKIGSNSIIGAGSVLIKNVLDNKKVIGNVVKSIIE